MQQVSIAAQALLTATARASIPAADMIRITAAALAENYCACVDHTCRACREAQYLDKIADKVDDRAAAVVHIVEACQNIGADMRDLLPGIVEGILERDPTACSCAGDSMCPTCSAARDLDRVHRELLAA